MYLAECGARGWSMGTVGGLASPVSSFKEKQEGWEPGDPSALS